MTIASSYDEIRDLTVFTVEGELTFDAQMTTLKEFYSGVPTANVLWDFRAIEGIRVSSKELYEIILFIKRHKSKRPQGKTALVSSKDIDFGLSRVSQAYADYEKLPWEMKAFRSMKEALKWIDRDLQEIRP
jgi:hypothetical protein